MRANFVSGLKGLQQPLAMVSAAAGLLLGAFTRRPLAVAFMTFGASAGPTVGVFLLGVVAGLGAERWRGVQRQARGRA